MIDEDGKPVVYLATVDYGMEDGGCAVISVHDTYEGASNALKLEGFRPACTFTFRGELYACKGRTVDEYPIAFIDKAVVKA